MICFKKNHGFVLFAVILLFCMISLLVLSQLQQLLKAMQISNEIMHQEKKRQQLEQIAWKLLQRPLQVCGQRQCSYREKEMQAHYRFDDLGISPCMRIIDNNKVYSAHHFQLTVENMDAKCCPITIRLAFPAPEQDCTQSHVSYILSGILSWH